MGTVTPWGISQYVRKYTRGINFYGTAGHGGIHVSKKLNLAMPVYLQHADGWYEEDVSWCKVAIAYPQYFSEKDREHAEDTFRNWFPNEWEIHNNATLIPGASALKDEAAFKEKHKNDFMPLTAWGDWHEKVPKGTVTVLASRGGLRGTENLYFNLPEKEYTGGHMILDPQKYKVVEAI